MEHAKMMTLTPINISQEEHPTEHSQEQNEHNKKTDTEKQKNLLQIALKIAEIGGYDEDLRIKTRNGRIVADTDIVGLILHSLAPMRNTKGLSDFVELLYQADVDPSLINNLQVRKMLENRIAKGGWKPKIAENPVQPTVMSISGGKPYKWAPKLEDIEPTVMTISGEVAKKKRKRRTPNKPKSHNMPLRGPKTEKVSANKRRNTLWNEHDSDLE